MPNSFRDLILHDFRSVAANPNENGIVISITRGIYTTTGIAAVPRSRASILETATGEQKVGYETDDFEVAAEDYVINGVVVLPDRGDRVTRTINGVATAFDVLPTDADIESHYIDAHHQRLLVRTKKAAA